ncbi:uncharacterized protein LOC131585147 isoform X1 [Poecile atricapillus]|uniref:uncharacterized protein LOC131585147 isoform X1 n=1 Tax=Poecile atricapillus TaxID=48891 RepID=UPI002738B5E1|nr:uncharacterized protein LOC131585147 isoform X1 [Poecile atricapillus]
MMSFAWDKMLMVIVLCVTPTSCLLTNIQKRQNIWVTLAHLTGQKSMCLSLATPGDPFRTCLIGVPEWDPPAFKGLVSNETRLNRSVILQGCNHTTGFTSRQLEACWQVKIIEVLNVTMEPPEELDLLGSTNTSGGWMMLEPPTKSHPDKVTQCWATVNPIVDLVTATESKAFYLQCNLTGRLPKRLPSSIFLICGDRAWNGIPASPHGGPCYLGKLTLFHPSLHQLLNVANKMKTNRRSKRSLNELQCNDVRNPDFWNCSIIWATSFFVPGAAAAKSLATLKRLVCWTRKELNLTSTMLSELSADVSSVRHAVLQN